MRLFIAIKFGEFDSYLRQLQGRIEHSDVQMTKPNEFHMTLKFLGEVEPSKIPKIKDALKKVNFEPFKCELTKLGVFKNWDYIRIIWAGIKDGRKLEELNRQIDDSLIDMFPRSKRFHPHITIARVKNLKKESKEEFIDKIKKIEIENRESTVHSFELISSELTPKGPKYKTLARFEAQT